MSYRRTDKESDFAPIFFGIIILIGACAFLLWGAFHLVAYNVSGPYHKWFDDGWNQHWEQQYWSNLKFQKEKAEKDAAPQRIKELEARIKQLEKPEPVEQ